jgi:hypothetical protein
MMATLANARVDQVRGEHFFPISAFVMTAVLVGGFSLQYAMGRSSFGAPISVHIHAFVFFGWAFLYLLQNWLATWGAIALHRRLGWLALGWIPALVVMGFYITISSVQRGRSPFFFRPAYFLIMNPMSVLIFAGLAIAALLMRRRTQWHRRLMFCAMTPLLGPGFGRILPMPLMIPWAEWGVFVAIILFPLAGILRDWRHEGKVHAAWWWGVAVIAGGQVAMSAIAFSPIGTALYDMATAGTAGAAYPPLAFPPPPGPISATLPPAPSDLQ